jgi:hypothetical protein
MRFISDLIGRGASWVKDHWRSIVSIAASAAIFTAVVWLMPVAAPALLTMAGAG